jgi:hypothetical protein
LILLEYRSGILKPQDLDKVLDFKWYTLSNWQFCFLQVEGGTQQFLQSRKFVPSAKITPI